MARAYFFRVIEAFFSPSPRLPLSLLVYVLLALGYLSSPLLHGQVPVESGNAPDSSALAFPTVGGEIFYVDDEQNLVNFYKLIPVGNDGEKEKLASYLATVLRDANAKVLGDMTVLEMILGFVYYDDRRTSYIFVSSKSEEIVTKEPYFNQKTGDIWFDMEGIVPDTAQFVSIWAFTRERGEDFRIVLRMSETVRLEMGKCTLLPEEFKRGKPYERTHGPFMVHAFGEYFSEPFVQMLPQECDTFTTVDFISYSDSIPARLGTMFGFRYELTDSTREGTFTFRTIQPSIAGATDDSQTEHFEQREPAFKESDDLIWGFEKTDELTPGTWIMQIIDGEKIIFEKKFFISILPPQAK